MDTTADIESDRARTRELHTRIRAAMKVAARRDGYEHRYLLLLWGYVRGFPYRRIERKTRVQRLPDGMIVVHNFPNLESLIRAARAMGVEPGVGFIAWLTDPAGAIPKPPPRVKPMYDYVREPAHDELAEARRIARGEYEVRVVAERARVDLVAAEAAAEAEANSTLTPKPYVRKLRV